MSHQMSTGNSHINTRLTLKEKYFFKKLNFIYDIILLKQV